MRCFRSLAATVALVLALAASAHASVDDALEAYRNGDYDAALREWQRLAAEGNPAAQNNIGQLYRLGQGVPQDDGEALKWFMKSAEQDFAAGQFNVGVMYQNGYGVDADAAKAAHWYGLAAAQNVAQAQHELGQQYEAGLGVKQDDAAAAEWYRKAAEQGYMMSRLKLAQMYAAGRGVAQDDVQAYMWLRLSRQGFGERPEEDTVELLRESIAARLSPNQQEAAESLARAALSASESSR